MSRYSALEHTRLCTGTRNTRVSQEVALEPWGVTMSCRHCFALAGSEGEDDHHKRRRRALGGKVFTFEIRSTILFDDTMGGYLIYALRVYSMDVF